MTKNSASYSSHFQHVPVLVTGGAGFIGSHLVEALAGLGAQVRAIDDLSGGDWANLSGFDQNVEKITASVLDRQALSRAVAGCRYVFHQAALGSVPRSLEQPERYFEVNVQGTVAVLEAARAAGVQRVMFASSSSVYGNPPDEGAKHEDLPLLPLSPYAATKAAGEHLMASWSAAYGFDTVPIRYFNVFGPRQNANSAYAAVIAAFAKNLCTGEPGTVYGDGEQSRDFTFVSNVVHGNLLAAVCPQPLAGQPVNVACGGRISVNELHRAMARMLGCKNPEPRYEPARRGEVRHSQAVIDRAMKVLGYQPQVDFETGLQQTVAWYQKTFQASGS